MGAGYLWNRCQPDGQVLEQLWGRGWQLGYLEQLPGAEADVGKGVTDGYLNSCLPISQVPEYPRGWG